MYPNPYAPTLPYYGYHHPQPQYSASYPLQPTTQQPDVPSALPPAQSSASSSSPSVPSPQLSSSSLSSSSNKKRSLEDVSQQDKDEPPVKRRKFSEKPPSPQNSVDSNSKNNSNDPSPSTSTSTPPATTNVGTTSIATTNVPTAIAPSGLNNNPSPMPSGPPPKELLDANPYGIVHMNGYVWCDACNRWFEIHCFDSHLLVLKPNIHYISSLFVH